MAEEIDCRKIFNSIEEKTQELLKIDLSEQIKQDAINIITSRVDEMHKLIDLKGEEFINQIIDSFTKDDKVVEKKEGDVQKRNPINKKEQKARDARLQEIDALTNIIEKTFNFRWMIYY